MLMYTIVVINADNYCYSKLTYLTALILAAGLSYFMLKS